MKILPHLLAPFLLAVLFGTGLFLGLSLIQIKPAYAETPPTASQPLPDPLSAESDTTPPVFPDDPLLSPASGAVITNGLPVFDWADATDAEGAVVSYTLAVSGSEGLISLEAAGVTTTGSIYTAATTLPTGLYTWTVQAHDAAGNGSGYTAPYTFTIRAIWQLFLPVVFSAPPPVCPTSSEATFSLVEREGEPANHPDYLHGDLNLGLRGYEPALAWPGLVDYNGSPDPNAPQLAGLFGPDRFPGISAIYQVYDWNWACGGHGCPGPLVTNPEVTLIDLIATPGEPIFIPERSPNIYADYKVMVLYAEEQRITLSYTRQDTVANGYSVHIENVCVDPNLLSLYRAQVTAEGWRSSNKLPALRNNQALGTALGSELRIAIRDRGTFGDPRSRKDWWRGY